ncbi:MAG TPA: LCP family protein [Nocardioides sp.]|nr:LCP family protein [Nocardioides sp.]
MSPGRGALALLGAAALLLVPDAQVAPAAVSLLAVESSTAVDFGDGTVHVLALGSDSSGADPRQGNADAIELISLDFESGAVSAVGIPRDTLVDLEGHGEQKINAGLILDGTDAMVREVKQLTGVQVQYVVTAASPDFEALVDAVGGRLRVHSDVAFDDPTYNLHVKVGDDNTFDGLQARGFAKARNFQGDDFARMGNQQELLRAILDALRGREDQVGFIESGALAALQHLDTNLSPQDLYRFAQAIGQLDPAQATSCVLTGPTRDVSINGDVVNVVDLDTDYAKRVAKDAADGVISEPCAP